MTEPTYVPESPTPLTTDEKLDKLLFIVSGHTSDLAGMKDNIAEINTKLSAIEETVGKHTGVLDGVAKDMKTVLDEKTIAAARFERLEKWAERVGEKIGIKLEL